MSEEELSTSLANQLSSVATVLRNYPLDETLGDATERFQTALYLATDGEEGRDWGIR